MKQNLKKKKKPTLKRDVKVPFRFINSVLATKMLASVVFGLVVLFSGQLMAQIPNRGFDSSVLGTDSTQSVLGTIPSFYKIPADTNLIYLRYVIPEKKVNRYYNPSSVMPKNPLFLDYRGGSYYVPRMVNNRIAQFMNRPSPDSFVPVFAVAALAAKLALEHIHIEQKIKINPEDYDLPLELHPILSLLWIKSPQTAFEIYQNDQVRSERTLKGLQKQLETLVDKKLIKVKSQEEAPAQYFVAQSTEQARESIRVYLSHEGISESHKVNLQSILLLLETL